MKKNLILTFCLLTISFISFAGKFVIIPVTETNNLVNLFNSKELKIHYYCDDYVLATTENLYYEDAIVLDNNAFANTDFYAIVYCAEDYKNEYLTKVSKSGKTLFSGKDFLIMEILSRDFTPAKNDGIVAVRDIQARLPKAKVYPVITEPNEDVLKYLPQVSINRMMADIQTLQDFVTRRCDHPNSVLAQNWIKEQLEPLDLEVFVHTLSPTVFPWWGGTVESGNVIAIQRGTKFPNEYVVCGAHYDSFAWLASEEPGADDNASGTAGIIEMARILSQYKFERSIIYCALAAEECGLYGSSYYADQCANEGMNIVAYFNMDMIGYVKPGEEIKLHFSNPLFAKSISDYCKNICEVYFPEIPFSYNNYMSASDHRSFLNAGYMGITSIEHDFAANPYYHEIDDIIGLGLNSPELVEAFVRANLAHVATLAMYNQGMPFILSPPANCLAVPHANNRVRVTWEEPLENSPMLYKVYRDGAFVAQIDAPKLEYINIVLGNNRFCYKVTAVYGTSESDFSNESCTALDITEYNPQIKLYPNPANDKIFIESQLINHNVEIFDINGKLMISERIDSDVATINISNLTSGIYFVRISNEVVGKFVKE